MKAKRIFTAILAFIIIAAVFTGSVSASDYAMIVDELKSLGSFDGMENSYEFDRMPTRAEAAALLVRLLGKESEAIKNNFTHPFTDVPKWADPYVGWLYENNLTNGIGDNKFGSEDLCDINMLCVFVLRALGYTEEAGDFAYDEAVDFAAELGTVYGNMLFGELMADFTFDDFISMIYNELPDESKNAYITLIKELLNDNSVNLRTDAEYINKANLVDEVNKLMQSFSESDMTTSYSANYETIIEGLKTNANLTVIGEDYAADVAFDYNNINYRITEYGKNGYIYLDGVNAGKIKHSNPYDSVTYTLDYVMPMMDLSDFYMPVDEVESIEKTISGETFTYKIIPKVEYSDYYYGDGVLFITFDFEGKLISLSIDLSEYYDGELARSMKVTIVFGYDIKIEFPDFSDYVETEDGTYIEDFFISLESLD